MVFRLIFDVERSGDIISMILSQLPIPWKSILTSKAVWVNHILQFGTTWGLFSLITLSPTYLKFIHGLHVKSVSAYM